MQEVDKLAYERAMYAKRVASDSLSLLIGCRVTLLKAQETLLELGSVPQIADKEVLLRIHVVFSIIEIQHPLTALFEFSLNM
jgi:hypothetical protein